MRRRKLLQCLRDDGRGRSLQDRFGAVGRVRDGFGGSLVKRLGQWRLIFEASLMARWTGQVESLEQAEARSAAKRRENLTDDVFSCDLIGALAEANRYTCTLKRP